MINLAQLATFYSTQINNDGIMIIFDVDYRVVFKNKYYEELVNNRHLHDMCDKIYDNISDDISVVKDSICLQGIRNVSLLNNKQYWVDLNMVETKSGMYYILHMHDISPIANEVLSKSNTTPLNQNTRNDSRYNDILTAQENEVLLLLLNGCAQKIITAQLNISRSTLNRLFNMISLKLFDITLSSTKLYNKLLQSNETQNITQNITQIGKYFKKCDMISYR